MGIVGFWWRRETGLTSDRLNRRSNSSYKAKVLRKDSQSSSRGGKPNKAALRGTYVFQIARWEVFGGNLPGIPKRIRDELQPLIDSSGGPAEWAAKQPEYRSAVERFRKRRDKMEEGALTKLTKPPT